MNMILNPELVPLLHGIKPFLGNKGQQMSDIMLNIVKLISSPEGQETINSLNLAIPEVNAVDGAAVVQTSLNLAFSLFLILVLLILSSGAVSFSNVNGDSIEQEEEIPDEVISSDQL